MNSKNLPVKVIQFGEGNFLRAFVDWMIDIMNEQGDFNGSVAVVQPLKHGLVDQLVKQNCVYHHLRQGLENGHKVDDIRKISCISQAINPYSNPSAFFALAEEPEAQLVFSNTTEAGIAFDSNDIPTKNQLATTFPGKLTQLLKKRFDHFKGDPSKGLAVIPCELIEQNGTELKKCIDQYTRLWRLDTGFQQWLNKSCTFANTLVDRIVPGYPKNEIKSLLARTSGPDQLIVKSETYHLFVIQAEERVRELFPAHKHGLNVKYVTDITPYRTQKVRILNGAHTAMVPIGLLYGLDTVSVVVSHPHVGKFIHQLIYEEIVPTIQIPNEDPQEFANEVIARFQNPFIRHELMSIALNSISKFKVRVLPTLKDYIKLKGSIPKYLSLSLCYLIKLYTSDHFNLNDDSSYLDFFKSIKHLNAGDLVLEALANTDLWGEDLTRIIGLSDQIHEHFASITSSSIKQ